jgi:hypothetical protein
MPVWNWDALYQDEPTQPIEDRPVANTHRSDCLGLPDESWQQVFNQHAKRLVKPHKQLLQPTTSNRRTDGKPEPLGLPVWDF